MSLHEDQDDVEVTFDGRVIRNLTDEEYEATYAEGTGGHVVDLNMPINPTATAIAQLDEHYGKPEGAL